ncbi:threonine ammonia-lyase, biosynthetic [Spirochaeta cellobiosiphila]|uniref:threonine ammonia-lyase, biosynthetic n=1 Tax=Spirochaeta cellobiosiphila TaxID=504483 RepID=UPI00048F747E|nr:threonine ammonia-lyase, biosynthetic [Spirochaeta cellobiosiphila]
MNINYIKKILSAFVYDVAIQTPISKAKFLSERINNEILLKREDLQPVFSFKIRGAYNKIIQLSEVEKKSGVIAASAGNHAQGVALAARNIGIKSVIVMPITTPEIKVRSVRSFGGEVVLFGDNFNAAYEHARELQREHGYTFIHPYDDPDVIAGQGTVGLEITRQVSSLDYIFVPVGGGGLLAGIATYIKFINPGIKIIGVESEDSACLTEAFKAKERIVLDHVGIFADGVAVKQVGEETFRLIKDNVDGTITVNTDEICAAIKDIYDDTRSIAEPAGALALAGLKKYASENKLVNQKMIAILSGANVNFDRLRHISERTEIGEKREGLFAVQIPETPGAFKTFCNVLKDRNITEFNYRYSDPDRAMIFAGVQLDDPVLGREHIMEALETQGYKVVDLSEDEISKLHVRYMIGGKAQHMANEHLFTFEFPERPGALADFLNGLGFRWNISLFHYRIHGADYGRVLLGIQVDKKDLPELKKYLDSTDYNFTEVNDNVSYSLFLK